MRLSADGGGTGQHARTSCRRSGAAHKKKFEDWLAEKYRDTGASSPDDLSRGVTLLMEGAFSSMLTHRDPAYAEAAGRTAYILVKNNLADGQNVSG